MNDVKIKSKNQSGGITGQNVNVNSGDQFNVTSSPEKEGHTKTFFWWLFGIAGFFASCVALYKFFS